MKDGAAKEDRVQPVNELDRLRELRKYNILDTLSEKDYDDITTMASIICDVPVALISFVDEKRQWFKSRHGVEETETPREYSFCSHAIERPDEPFIVPDARTDERFRNNPLVTGDPNIVFYAGMPLVNSSGFGLGTVCIIDTKPRELTDKQLKALRILSDQVLNLLELHKINGELSAINFNLSVTESVLRKENDELENAGKGLRFTLDKHIAERVKDVANQNIELERMNQELQAFTYISSHDLQEPLRKIQTFSSYIKEREAGNLTEKGLEYFGKIANSAERMSMLIKDLLAYSRHTTSDKKLEQVELSAIVDDVVIDLEEEIRTKQATVRRDSDCVLDVIPFQFRQVIYNILSNAIKFTRRNIAPVVEISCETRPGTEIDHIRTDITRTYRVISISDNGIGFDNRYSEKIFGLFQRLESHEIAMGTGIGLAIVKKVVDNHHGFVTAFGKPEHGTTFVIYLPML